MSNIRKSIDSHLRLMNGKWYAYHKKSGMMFECNSKKAARLVYINGYKM
jgi:hypothetical protein